MAQTTARNRKAREFVLQLLFQEDMAGNPPAEILAMFWKANRTDGATRDFAENLFNRYVVQRRSIDDLIARNAKNWKMERMAVVDRSILRLAVSEFLSGATPAVVVIDEAIELARKFSGDESTVFVNGVLDSIRKELDAGSSKVEVRSSSLKKVEEP